MSKSRLEYLRSIDPAKKEKGYSLKQAKSDLLTGLGPIKPHLKSIFVFSDLINQGLGLKKVGDTIDELSPEEWTPKTEGQKTAHRLSEYSSYLWPTKAAGKLAKELSKQYGPKVLKYLGIGLTEGSKFSHLPNVTGAIGSGELLHQATKDDKPLPVDASDIEKIKDMAKKFGISLVGGVVGGFTGAAASKLAKSAYNAVKYPGSVRGEILGVNPSKVEAMNRAGLRKTLGDVSDSAPVKSYQWQASKAPLSHSEIQNVRQAQKSAVERGVGVDRPIIGQEHAGEIVKEGAINRENLVSQRQGKYADELAREVQKRDPSKSLMVRVDESAKRYQQMLNDIYTDPRKIRNFSNSPAGKSLERLMGGVRDDSHQIVTSGTGKYNIFDSLNSGRISREKLLDIRTELGRRVKKLKERDINSNEYHDAAQLYNEIADSLDRHHYELNEQAGRTWQEKNMVYKKYKQNEEPVLHEIEKLKGDKPYKKLKSSPSEIQENIMQSIAHPEDQENLLARIMSDLGGGKGVGEDFSNQRWATNWRKLDPRTRVAYAGKEGAHKLDALAEAQTLIGKSYVEGNPSGSSAGTMMQKLRRGAWKTLEGIATKNPEKIADAIMPLVINRDVTQRFFTNDALIDKMAQGLRLKNVLQAKTYIHSVKKNYPSLYNAMNAVLHDAMHGSIEDHSKRTKYKGRTLEEWRRLAGEAEHV